MRNLFVEVKKFKKHFYILEREMKKGEIVRNYIFQFTYQPNKKFQIYCSNFL